LSTCSQIPKRKAAGNAKNSGWIFIRIIMEDNIIANIQTPIEHLQNRNETVKIMEEKYGRAVL
jgi:hypothetical protein